MLRARIYGIIIVIICGICSTTLAQTGIRNYGGTRGMGLAGTGVLLRTSEGLYVNPASIAFLESWDLSLSSELRFGQSGIRQIGLSAALPTKHSGSIGLTLQQEGVLSLSQTKISLNYAKQLHEQISIGAQINLHQLSIENYGTQSAINAAIGAIGQITDNIRVGFSILNPFPVSFIDGQVIPTSLLLATSIRSSEQLSIFVEVQKEIDFAVNAKAAIEYTPIKSLALRLGVQTEPSVVSFGTGIRLSEQLVIDMAINYHDQLGYSPGLGLRFGR